MGKGSFHARVWPKLVGRGSALLQEGDRVLVAVSGGADSVCLLDFLSRWGERRRVRIRAAHFDHGLRAGSSKDAAFTLALARRLGAEAEVVKLPVRARAARDRSGVEAAGRALRYEALARLARKHGCNKVATGHHADDQAETLLLHLLRGTNPAGLAGVPERRGLAPGVEVVRPLLSATRADIREYLRYRKLAWREDPTNRSEKYLRNWVRRRLLPLLERKAPGTAGRLATLAAGLGAALRAPSTRAGGAPARARSTARRRRAPRDA
ncbi:MAG: tRNA lysidine(34) synthetase TilS [Elusimicrobia bacterium]|nr:tRNA lysidine(34) synthetase TilS [Elusimicrobiota bacterium]